MEIIIAVIGIAIVAVIVYLNREAKTLDLNDDVVQEKKILDVNNDGKVDAEDAKAAVKKAVNAVRNAGDVNKDGKVDVKDVVAAGKKVKAAVKAKTTRKSAPKKTATKSK
jgi:Ca2+-binding EF-hand superfamily protein